MGYDLGVHFFSFNSVDVHLLYMYEAYMQANTRIDIVYIAYILIAFGWYQYYMHGVMTGFGVKQN